MSNPKLWLIGAGPGDPELITLKAIRALQEADVVLYDSLVNTQIFDIAFANRPSPELIWVGKRKGLQENPQDSINELILAKLQAGLQVVRLKGGDPLVFARGLEELAIAHNNGFAYQVIPGLTSGLAAASLDCIGLTLREQSQGIYITTGHSINKKVLEQWQQILQTGSTIIIYMGLSNIVEICSSIEIPNLHAIVVANASQSNQKLIKSTINKLPQEIIDQRIESPALIYLGLNVDQCFKPSSHSINLTELKVS